MLAAQEDRLEVDALHALPGLELGVEDRGVVVGGDPGVVEEHVDAAEALAGLRVQSADGVLVGDVGDEREVASGVPARVDADDLSRPRAGRRALVAAPMPPAAPVTTHDLALQATGHQPPSVAMKIVLTSV